MVLGAKGAGGTEDARAVGNGAVVVGAGTEAPLYALLKQAAPL